MKKETNLTLGISEPEKVTDFIAKLDHPLVALVQYLRKTILAVDANIGEGIYWNGPTFYFTGAMQPFNPKEYKRYIVGLNFYKQDTIRLVFLHGANASNESGLLEGDYKDGRRLISFKSIDNVKSKQVAFEKIVLELVTKIDR
ncbi:MAG: DUF1801 domain-containing protein [Bacteroidota bacterium]